MPANGPLRARCFQGQYIIEGTVPEPLSPVLWNQNTPTRLPIHELVPSFFKMGAIQPSHSQTHHRKRLTKLPQAFAAAIAVILFIQFTILPRFLSSPSVAVQQLEAFQLQRLEEGLRKCSEYRRPVVEYAFRKCLFFALGLEDGLERIES